MNARTVRVYRQIVGRLRSARRWSGTSRRESQAVGAAEAVIAYRDLVATDAEAAARFRTHACRALAKLDEGLADLLDVPVPK